MPKTIKNDDGTEEEVFTKEELEAESKRKAEEEASRIEAEEAAKREDLEEQLRLREEELKKKDDKDQNWKALREKAKKEEDSKSETKKELETIKETLNKVLEQPIQQTKKNFIEQNVGMDKEARDKFEYFYKKTGANAKTEEEVAAALQEALVLTNASGVKVIKKDSRMITTNPDLGSGSGSEGESEASREFGKAFGLSDEDKKKYGKDINLF